MRNTVAAAFLFCLIALGISSRVCADVLYEQSAIAFGFGGGPDMLATAFVSNQDEAQPDVDNSIVYDNFTLVSDMIVQGVQWAGGYNGLFNNNSNFRGDIDFLVDFFPHDAVGDKPNTAAGIRSFVLNSGSSGNDDGTDVTTTQNPLETLRDGGRVFDYSSSRDGHQRVPTAVF